jgi:hypothetical protein
MEREIKGYIKFKDKKVITRPLEGQSGLIKTWEMSDAHNSKEYFVYNGTRYQLVSVVETD